MAPAGVAGKLDCLRGGSEGRDACEAEEATDSLRRGGSEGTGLLVDGEVGSSGGKVSFSSRNCLSSAATFSSSPAMYW